MSGHSKWHSIKHRKAAVDARRGKIFTRLIREISVAARTGGGDPATNPRLRTAVQAARDANMPRQNIDRAIKKGTGELPGAQLEEVIYEGYGPAGVAIYIEALTDNKNRTTAEIRHLFGKYGGHMGEVGCVAWMFSHKGSILIPAEGTEEDALMEVAIEAGAEDLINNGDSFTITTELSALESVRSALGQKNVTVSAAEVQMIPNSTIKVEGKEAERILKLLSALEDHDDVQKVSANFDIADELIEQLSSQ